MADIRGALLHKRALPAVVLASTVAVLGHVLTFLIAARAVGVTAPVSRLLPLAFVSMMAMVLPNIGGWGPREGVTAWAFSAAGLGAGRGAATAVAYGVMVLAASLPGGLVLLSEWLPWRRGSGPRARKPLTSGQRISRWVSARTTSSGCGLDGARTQAERDERRCDDDQIREPAGNRPQRP